VSIGGSSLARALHSEAHQLSLLGVDAQPDEIDALRGSNGRLPSDAFRQLRSAAVRTGKPGRPLNSPNKRTEQLAKLVIQEFGDPVLGAASLYAMPLDQLCELLLVADGTMERAERTEELTTALAAQVSELGAAIGLAAKRGDVADLQKAADRLADAAESLENLAKSSGKAGALALAALNTQLTARRFVAEYVHSKKAVAVDVMHKSDGLLIMPGVGRGAGEAEAVRDMVNAALRSGRLEADQVARLEFKDGRLSDPDGEIVDADFEAVPNDGDDDA
jgi:hypothetical protein